MELKNEHLRVCFALPEEFPSQRFDNTARITQVWLGDHAFCMPEQLLPGRRTTGGVGLTGEFVLETAAQEAAAGRFPGKSPICGSFGIKTVPCG